MRALFVTPFYEESRAMGGMAIAPALWAQSLVSSGVDVDVFTTPANGNTDLVIPLMVPVEHKGVNVTYFPRLKRSGNLFISFPLFRATQQVISDYDVVHSIGLWTFPSIISSAIARRAKIPYILSLHGMLMPWAYSRHMMRKKLLMALFEKKRITNAAHVLCTSNLEKQYFQQLGFTDAIILPNIVFPSNIDVGKARQRFRQNHKLGNSTVLLFVGRLVRNKGLHLTISALKQVIDRFPDIKLLVVGPFEDDSGRLALEQVESLQLDKHVIFLGLLQGTDYWRAIASADLFVLNSYSENFGMAPAEALSCGVPVLLSDQVGIADWVRQYDAGKTTALDVKSIADMIVTMISDKENLAMMGKNGVQLVQEQFSPIAVVPRFADLMISSR